MLLVVRSSKLLQLKLVGVGNPAVQFLLSLGCPRLLQDATPSALSFRCALKWRRAKLLCLFFTSLVSLVEPREVKYNRQGVHNFFNLAPTSKF
jgi:hypothetical protein